MCMCECLDVCMCTVCMSGVYGSQKKVSDLLGLLELQMVVSCPVGAGK